MRSRSRAEEGGEGRRTGAVCAEGRASVSRGRGGWAGAAGRRLRSGGGGNKRGSISIRGRIGSRLFKLTAEMNERRRRGRRGGEASMMGESMGGGGREGKQAVRSDGT